MTQTQTLQIVDTLNAWLQRSALADDLVPQTQALIAQLTAKPAKRQTARSQSVDTATLTDAELFAYYKRIGLREDVRFFIDHARGIPEATQLEAAMLYTDLLSRKATTADRKLYNRLTDSWRRATNDAQPAAVEAEEAAA